MNLVNCFIIILLFSQYLTLAIATDICDPNPCQNGGTCSIVEGKRMCKCADYFSGDFCETGSASCRLMCGPGELCRMGVEDGQSPCVPSSNPCDFMGCNEAGTVCFVRGGKAVCEDPCDTFGCPYACKKILRKPVCYNPCTWVRCSKDKPKCVVIENEAVCTAPEQCGDSHPCQNGGKCSKENVKISCACVDGFYGEYCESTPAYCRAMCAEGEVCISAIGDPCHATSNQCVFGKGCPSGTACYIRNGQQSCEDPCSTIKCDGTCYTDSNTRVPVCKSHSEPSHSEPETDPCKLTKCPSDTYCKVDGDKAVCKNLCDLVSCPKDKPICVMKNGSPECLGVCEALKCPENKPVCSVEDGKPVCMETELASCKQTCKAGNSCHQFGKRFYCLNACMFYPCDGECVIQNGKPHCIATDPCEEKRCYGNEICVEENGLAVCKENDPCYNDDCPVERPHCLAINGHAYCVDDPCMTVSCGKDTQCLVVHGKGKCVGCPSMLMHCFSESPSCRANKDCESDEICCESLCGSKCYSPTY